MSETTSTVLVEFLRARLAEDERTARAAQSVGSPTWLFRIIRGEPDGYSLDFTDERVLIIDWTGEDELLPPEAEHAARHDPARVLAEVEAKRRLIQRYECAASTPQSVSSFVHGQDDGYRQACLDAIKDAAEVHATHPDYDEEWRL